ncbi:MAG: serine/threonine protein kinase, partial [Thermoanaerobaculia bacterium]
MRRSRFRSLPALAVLCLVSTVLVSAAPDSRSAEWPQWRGPNRDGVSKDTGLLTQWPASGPPLSWKATGLGAGFSSLAIAGGKIFTLGDREGSQQLVAL